MIARSLVGKDMINCCK